MNVTKLEIVADETAGNVKAGAVVAYRRAGDEEWRDPHGGFFNEREQGQLDDLARGECDYVHLDDVRQNGDRTFAAHLVATF